MWIVPLIIAVFGAVFFMNNLTSARSTFKDQLAIVGRKHTWIMSYIYIGTFGSFIGYSAAFPLLIKTQFPAVTVAIAFLGPLVGSLSRPLGGLLADKVGGAIVTFWNFIAMGAATIGVMYFVEIKEFAGFLAMFLILFVTTGIGNGSTYRMIPSIFREEKLREAKGSGEAARALAVNAARIESGAALGFIGAIGACGGYLIPRGFGASIAATGGPHLALEIYLAFYATCLALTWWYYLRKSFFAEHRKSRRCACVRQVRAAIGPHRDDSQWSLGRIREYLAAPTRRGQRLASHRGCQSSNDHAKFPRSLAGMKRKLVVVGAGMASGRVLEHLPKATRDAYEVTLFGAEPRGNYNRIMLSRCSPARRSTKRSSPTPRLVRRAQRELPVRRDGHQNRSRGQDGAYAKRRNTLRQIGDRHRLGAFHHSGGRQGIAGRAYVPRPR